MGFSVSDGAGDCLAFELATGSAIVNIVKSKKRDKMTEGKRL